MPYTNFPNGLTSFGIPLLGSGGAEASYFGTQWFVDTVNGADGNDGRSPQTAFATMNRAFYFSDGSSNLSPNDTIWFVGTVREQLVAPLTKTIGGVARAVTGVSIYGMQGGGVRDDDGAKWTYPASGAVAGQALLACRQQGWTVGNFLMTPEPTSGAAIKLNRAEDAVNPDASHFVASGMRFVGIDVTTTYGIQDVGGCSNVLVQDCEFYLLTTGLYSSSQAIATPLRWKIYNNRFLQNTNDIVVPSSYGVFSGNAHMTNNTTVINIASGGNCTVKFNSFPNAAADIDPANGYDGNATDVWTSNSATDAVVFGDPA